MGLADLPVQVEGNQIPDRDRQLIQVGKDGALGIDHEFAVAVAVGHVADALAAKANFESPRDLVYGLFAFAEHHQVKAVLQEQLVESTRIAAAGDGDDVRVEFLRDLSDLEGVVGLRREDGGHARDVVAVQALGQVLGEHSHPHMLVVDLHAMVEAVPQAVARLADAHVQKHDENAFVAQRFRKVEQPERTVPARVLRILEVLSQIDELDARGPGCLHRVRAAKSIACSTGRFPSPSARALPRRDIARLERSERSARRTVSRSPASAKRPSFTSAPLRAKATAKRCWWVSTTSNTPATPCKPFPKRWCQRWICRNRPKQ